MQLSALDQARHIASLAWQRADDTTDLADSLDALVDAIDELMTEGDAWRQAVRALATRLRTELVEYHDPLYGEMRQREHAVWESIITTKFMAGFPKLIIIQRTLHRPRRSST